MSARALLHHRRRGLPSALGLTCASALLWGVAHLYIGRTRAGVALLALQAALITMILLALTALRLRLIPLALRPEWLTVLVGALVLIGAVWVAVVILSYRAVRPARATSTRPPTGSGGWASRPPAAPTWPGSVCSRPTTGSRSVS